MRSHELQRGNPFLELRVEALAAAVDRIAYEILVGVGPRVRRVPVRSGSP